MSESLLPALPSTVAEVATKNLPRIIQGNEIAIKFLKDIQETPITNDEQREAAIGLLSKTKAVCDKVDLLVKEVVGPMEDFIEQVKSYKKSIDYASKTKDGNEYTKARAIIEAYDQAKAKETERLRLEAEFKKKQNLYKSEIKEGVGRRMVAMIAGQKKNIIDGMSQWEAKLTLANLETSFDKLANQKPSLKQDKYDACFTLDFMSPNKGLLNPTDTQAYMNELKQEYPFDKYNTEYVEAVAPIINEYRARKEEIKKKLEDIQKASEETRIAMEEERKAALNVRAQEGMKAVEAEQAAGLEKVEHEREMDKMNAEFTEQVQTQDLEDGPSKNVATFEDNTHYLKPFAEVIGACALNPKFPGIMKKNGTDYIDAVQWWLDQYASYATNNTIKGIAVTKVAKTIIRKK